MVMRSDKHKLAYFSVPKAACTTLKRVIFQVDEGRPFRMADQGGTALHRSFPTQDYSASTMQGLGDHWKFTVIRDPARRILSAYNNKIGIWSARIARALKRPDRRDALLADGIEEHPSLDAFLLNIDAYRRHFKSIRHHTDLHQVFLGPDLSAFDQIYRIEEMEDLRQELSRRVGRNVKFPQANTSTTKAEPATQAARDALMDYVASDYAYLSRFYPLPASTLPARSQTDAVPLLH